jgi:hypothetical protein
MATSALQLVQISSSSNRRAWHLGHKICPHSGQGPTAGSKRLPHCGQRTLTGTASSGGATLVTGMAAFSAGRALRHCGQSSGAPQMSVNPHEGHLRANNRLQLGQSGVDTSNRSPQSGQAK